MSREVVDRWCERGILGLVLATLVFTPLAFGGEPQDAAGIRLDFLVVNPFLVAEVCMVAATILWGVRLWLNPRPKLLWPPICWAVVAFAVYAVIRYLTADIEYVARQEMIRVLVYALLFFIILNNLYSLGKAQIIIVTLVFLAMAISFYAVYQFVTDSNRVWQTFKPYAHRASGTYISPNHLGGFLEMLIPIALSLTVVSRLKPLIKVLLGYSVLVMVGGIAVTVSRGSWISTAVALALFFGALFFHEKFRLPTFIFLFVTLVAAGFFLPKTYIFQMRMRQLFAHGKLDTDMRLDLWRPAVKVWQENPWWGAGPAHFDFRFRKYRPDNVQLQPERAHNDYLNAVTDWGIVGTAIIFTGLVLVFVGVVRTWRYVRGVPSDLAQKSSSKFAIVIGCSAGLAAALCHSSVDFNMHIPANAMIAVLYIALLSSYLRFATERYWVSLGPVLKGTAGAILSILVVYLGWQTVHLAREKFWLARAAVVSGRFSYSPAQVALQEKAFDIERRNSKTASDIGQAYLVQSKEGAENYQELAAKAMQWFARGMKLNPWDGYNFLYYGICLDWVNRSAESGPYFARAEELDPNGHTTVGRIGLHYIEIRDFAAARPWLERSQCLQGKDNPAHDYLGIVTRRMLEAGTNDISAKLHFSQ
jgi:O-antigen ligase